MAVRTITAPLLALVFALCLAPAPAGASVSTRKAIWGPLEVGGVSQFPVYERLGVGVLQMAVRWDAVAPTRPARPSDPADAAYRWPPEVDRAISEGARHGVRIALMVIGAPGWANGGRAWNGPPTRPADFATFMGAAARRWPGVHRWMVWGEPTKAQNWLGLVADHGAPLRGAGLRAPRLYARMLDASYAALKRVSRANLVIGGNSYTVGTVAPLRWIRALRLPDGRPPRMDLYGHNPFTRRLPDLRAPPLGDGYADFSDLDTLAVAIDANLRRDRHRPGPRIFVSELSFPTDHANAEFNFFLDRATQARFLRAALRTMRATPRIATLGYLGLYDDPLRDDGLQVERGLLERDGTPKPAFAVFAQG